MDGQERSATEALYQALWGFAPARILGAAARTGLLRALAAGYSSPEELASTSGLDRAATAKTVRALTAIGVVEVAAEGGRYRLAPVLADHFGGGEADLTPFVEHLDTLNGVWGATLEGWLRGEELPRRTRDADATRRFGRAMWAAAGMLAPQVAGALRIGEASRVLDLGGGFGRYAVTFCRQSPGLRVTVVDRPEVVALGAEAVAETEVADRIELVGGDYHEVELGEGFDVVLLANVLHQENAQRARELVDRAAAASAPGGAVAVVDFPIDEERQAHLMGALFAVNMRSFGDTYPASEIRGWMEEAGLRPEAPRALEPSHWLIVGRKESSP